MSGGRSLAGCRQGSGAQGGAQGGTQRLGLTRQRNTPARSGVMAAGWPAELLAKLPAGMPADPPGAPGFTHFLLWLSLPANQDAFVHNLLRLDPHSIPAGGQRRRPLPAPPPPPPRRALHLLPRPRRRRLLGGRCPLQAPHQHALSGWHHWHHEVDILEFGVKVSAQGERQRQGARGRQRKAKGQRQWL